MASICGDSVLTGQGQYRIQGSGTSFCLDDFSDFGTDGTDTHITVPCEHDFRVGDLVAFYETNNGNIDSALTASTDSDRIQIAPRSAVDGTILTLGSFVAGSGYTDNTYTDEALTGGNGSGATATIVVASGEVTDVTHTDGGSDYDESDQLTATLAGGGSGFIVEVDDVLSLAKGVVCYYIVGTGSDWIEVSATDGGTAITMKKDGGTGTADQGIIEVELCDFTAMCGVREFSIDVSREELDTTVLPATTASVQTAANWPNSVPRKQATPLPLER